MGCVAALRQTAVVGIQQRLTRCFRGLKIASQQHKNLPRSQAHFNSRAGALDNEYFFFMSTSSMKKRRLPRDYFSPGGWYNSSQHVVEKPAGRKKKTVRGSKLLSAKKGFLKLRKSSGFFVFAPIFGSFDVRILAVILLLCVRVVCICCGNAYARLLDIFFLGETACPQVMLAYVIVIIIMSFWNSTLVQSNHV